MLHPCTRWASRQLQGLLVALVAVGVTGTLASAQQGSITGTVRNGETLEPLSAVQLSIEGRSIGTLSSPSGVFTIEGVPPGTHTVSAQRIGFQPQRRENVSVTGGGSVAIEFTMNPAVLSIQGVVATGLIDPVEGTRSPITVAQVTREMMPVTVAGSALQNLQGRVPGLQMNRLSGEPGEEVSIMLRTPTSVVMGGEPLVIVDGVILGSGTANIESLDIESMEVIKGAAAASLYGSRAASGVISITTNRGRSLDLGQTQFTVRSEAGFSQPITIQDLPSHHFYLMDPAQTTYVDASGNPVTRAKRVSAVPSRAFMDQPYPGPLFDNLGTVFRPGNFQTHTFSVAQNAADTNFQLTLNRNREEGAVENNEGYARHSFRLNLDHRFLNAFALATSVYHSRDHRDNMSATFGSMLRAPRDVDLRAKDAAGNYLRIPDATVAFENPLWQQVSQENDLNRLRTLASFNLRWEPLNWASAMMNVSYDRGDESTRYYLPKGTPRLGSLPADGEISFDEGHNDTWNAESQVSFRRDFGPLNARTTFRGLLESNQLEARFASGTNFFVTGVPRIDVAKDRYAESYEENVTALGYLWDTALDYQGKYIGTALVRRDGSSLFGADNRWQTYYRVAGAYRLSEEDWFNIPNVDELKFSYARGTAGGRPAFEHQYETWNVTSSGVSMGVLGNRELRPEHTTEQEVSVESILFGRYGIDLTHAWHRTTDQLDFRRVPAFTGFSNQWVNGGVMVGHTTELTIEAQLIQTPSVSWSTMVVADQSKGHIESWPQCRTVSYRYYCGGIENNTQWSGLFLTRFDQLDPNGNERFHGPEGPHHGGKAWDFRDEFQINDDGYLVWVGAGNNYWEGVDKQLWGTTRVIDGFRYDWGVPVQMQDGQGTRQRAIMGRMPTSGFGWLNNLRFGAVSFHSQIDVRIDGSAHCTTCSGLASTNDYPLMDQTGKAEGLKKPIAYYQAMTPPGSAFNFDGQYLKLRTLSMSYAVPESLLRPLGLARVQGMTVGLIGRNLFTLTSFPGPDPEVGNLNSRLPSDGDSINSYPRTRTLTAELSLTF